ncbi:DUF757-domain-containing protein [Clavulina sp. PMI_390]|nr:DUF757-domain-containing protein [Clavulina sp. PMI_390]
MSITPLGKFDPNKAENHEDIEKQFAVVAVQHAQVYWNLLEKVPPSTLKLTKLDDEIFEDFKAKFPELFENDAKGLALADEDAMKSDENKARWRNFIQPYEKRVNQYNFGSLLRLDATDEYSEHNAIFVTRMQFLAFEIARNRLKLNDEVHRKAKEEAS